jgi:ABC-type nitrate/sulfonate/bicarbonate transport system substrate-binding protein
MNRRDFSSLLAAGALGGVARPAGAQSAAVSLSVGTNAADDVTPLLWAKATGMFAKAGLDVDIQKLTSGSAVTSAVIGGSIDIGRSSVFPLISARNHGVPVKLIAPAELTEGQDPSGALIVLKDSPITSGHDLNGQTLASPALKDYFEISTRAWIDANGGDSKTTKFVELPIASDLAALEAGRIAAVGLPNPFLANALATGKVRVLGRPNTAIAKRFLVTGYFAMETFIDQHRDALARFARTMHDSTVYTVAHPAETVAVVAPFWGVDPQVLANMARSTEALTLDPKDLQPMIDVALRYGVIDKPMKAESMMLSFSR